MNASELNATIFRKLKQAEIADARLEARLLTAHVVGIDPTKLSPVSTVAVSSDMVAAAESLMQRRITGEPLQYLLGIWEFMGLPFYVEEGVLIPRADTEILCESALRLISERGYQTVLDLCCGSGCIGITLAKLSDVSVVLADISTECLAMSQKNAELNQVAVSTIHTDLFSALKDQKFDLICCNPPYLTATDMENLQTEVRHEPSLALYGGVDGLAFYRRIAAEYRSVLNPQGALLLEIGSSQAESVGAMFGTETVWKDYAGHPRVVYAEN